MANFRMNLAERTFEFGSVRFTPGDFLGIVELGDGIAPERVCRAMREGLVILEKVEEPEAPESKKTKKRAGKNHGINT